MTKNICNKLANVCPIWHSQTFKTWNKGCHICQYSINNAKCCIECDGPNRKDFFGRSGKCLIYSKINRLQKILIKELLKNEQKIARKVE